MKNKPILFLMNGLIGCGKDTGTGYLIANLPYRATSVKAHLYELTNKFFNFPAHHSYVYHNEKLKEQFDSRFRISFWAGLKLMSVVPALRGKLHEEGQEYLLSPRQALIFVSEVMAKPVFGKEYFAKVHVSKIKETYENSNFDVFIESSCGFQEEYDYYARCDFLIPQVIRITGRGEEKPDSRSQVFGNDQDIIVDNSGRIDDFFKDLENKVKSRVSELRS